MDHSTAGTLSLKGMVHGGQQPVSNSTIHLYYAGNSGNGSAANDMLSVSGSGGTLDYVTTGSDGSFSITGDYSCTSSSDQVYIVASGGNPGLAPGTDNTALVLMAALGSCGNLSSSTNMLINEVTTAAAAWALAPFMTSATNVGGSPTNISGLTNGFLDAQLLANNATGTAATLASNLTIETGKLYALANVLANCVNSNGATTGCSQLFSLATPPGGTAPTNTLNAALDIVSNPGHNVSEIYTSAAAQTAFPSTLTGPPNDWTMSLSVTGGGLSSPEEMEIDSNGVVWAASYSGLISAFTALGTPFSSAGFGSSVLGETFGLTIDNKNNVWATNEENPGRSNYTAGSVVAFYGVGSGSALGSVFTTAEDNSIDFPESLAADGNGDILIGNYASGSATIYNSSGALVSAGLGSAYNTGYVYDLVSDGAGGVWLANSGSTYVSHIDANGTLAAQPDCCNSADGITRDGSGNIWVSNYNYGPSATNQFGPGSVSEISSTGAVLINQETGVGGIAYPARISVDAGQNVWVANYHGASFTELAGSTAATPGAALSPSSGFGLDASLLDPYDIVPDESGNIWVTSSGNDELVMFFGLATPTATPRGPAPIAP